MNRVGWYSLREALLLRARGELKAHVDILKQIEKAITSLQLKIAALEIELEKGAEK